MQGTRVAFRYAKSLMRLALEKGELEKAYVDMLLIHTTCKNSKDLSLFLKSPIIKTDKKQKTLKEIFGAHISKISQEFVEIITRKKREIFLESIAEDFVSQYKTHKKILTAVITSAAGLDDTLRKRVLEIVKNNSTSEVELIEKTDKSIIGGFVLRIGDKQVDASIARKLQQLAMSFSENPYIKEY